MSLFRVFLSNSAQVVQNTVFSLLFALQLAFTAVDFSLNLLFADSGLHPRHQLAGVLCLTGRLPVVSVKSERPACKVQTEQHFAGFTVMFFQKRRLVEILRFEREFHLNKRFGEAVRRDF